MPTYRITYRTRPQEFVDADELRREGAFVVLVRCQVVILQARDVVVRRIALADLDGIDQTSDACDPPRGPGVSA